MEYGKHLTEILKIRISKSDLEFYKQYAADLGVCLSEAIRYVLTDYRKDNQDWVMAENVASTNKRH